MNDSDDDFQMRDAIPELPKLSERAIEKLEIMAERLNALGHRHQDGQILEIQHQLWLITRWLRNDEELSYDDIDL